MGISSSSTRSTVESKDGTVIAFDRLGRGPTVVFVHGSLAAGRTWQSVVNLLTDEFTCYVMDRRGRGRSGDHPAYSVEREYEDIEAVIAATGEVPSVVGHSFGAVCALGAAVRTRVRKLVLYEPPLTPATPSIVDSRFPPEYEAAVCSGDDDVIAEVFLHYVAGVHEDQVRAMRAGRGWGAIRNMAPSVVREAAVVRELGPDWATYKGVMAPTLLLTGSESAQSYRAVVEGLADVLPNAHIQELEGQRHLGISTAPEMVARLIRSFLFAI